jgi:tyrosyl-tRNA synthetase
MSSGDLEIFRRNAVDLIEGRELEQRLGRGKPLRVKFGMDPSAPDLHLGHAVQLFKLRALQRAGHTIVLIVGDATAMVGDPSGRNKLRPQLSRAEVEKNLATYTSQAGAILDLERTEVRRNSEWFDKMGFHDVLELAGRMTVARMIERDTFEKRMAAAEPIGIHEFLYPLMQGWDSVVIRCDVELGGTDQLFNLLVGRDLQQSEEQDGQICLTLPLIDGLDGRKMSKSYGNAVGLTDPPGEMFGRIMSIADGVMPAWYRLLTDLGETEVESVLAGHPREAKARLAAEITGFFHGAAAARDARAAFDRQFRDRQVPDDVPEVAFPRPWPSEGVPLAILLREVALAKSAAEARRLISQGAVRVAGEVARDPEQPVLPPSAPLLVQVGKRHFARLVAR